jgi:hypothetical protein
MSFNGANVNRKNGGIQKAANDDRVIVLIMGMTAVGSLVYGKAVEILDIKGAEALGITETTDNTNGELAHYHLDEMTRLKPGFTYWLIPVAKTTTVAQLVADANLKETIRGIKNRNVIGIGGLNTLVSASLTDAVALQGWVNAFADEHILIDGVVVEGVGGATQIAITGYNNNRSITASGVNYVIAQDPAIASLNAAYAKRAAIGTALGSIAVRYVHEDIGSVSIDNYPDNRKGEESFSLVDETRGRWLSAALSDGKTFSSMSAAEQKSLSNKGWWYVGRFEEYDGYYLNGCPSCVDKDSDYAYFNNNCIWNKGARLIRRTLIPLVRSGVPKKGGLIDENWIDATAGLVRKNLEVMIAQRNITDMSIFIDPAQTVNEDTPLKVSGWLQIKDIVHEFSVDVGLTNKL